MAMFHLLKIRTSIDIFKMKSVKLLLALSICKGSGSITSVGEERANLSAVVYL